MAAPDTGEGQLVDVGTGILRRDRVLVQHAPAAVVVMGFGPRADGLRRFACGEAAEDDDPFLDRCRGVASALDSGRLAKAERAKLPRTVLKIGDPLLRRLAVAEALAKAGYDPDEPRDERGRWTSEGGGEGGPAEGEAAGAPNRDRNSGVGAAAAAAAATLAPSATEWAFAGDISLPSLLGLAEMAARYSPAGVFLGTYFFGINRTYKTQGVVPDRPDISWEYDADTLALTLSRNGEIIDAGQNQYGVIRDRQGRVVGRMVGGNIAFDRGAVSAAVSAADSGTQSDAGAQSRAETEADRAEPKLCPATEPEDITKRSEQAKAYEEQITQLPAGLVIKLIDPTTGKLVSFDGCCTPANPYCPQDGKNRLLDAKARGYEKHMTAPDTWAVYYKGDEQAEAQMERQSRAASAAGWVVDWYFAEPGPAAYFAEFAKREKLVNVTVHHMPPRSP